MGLELEQERRSWVDYWRDRPLDRTTLRPGALLLHLLPLLRLFGLRAVPALNRFGS
jgi:hypothetical protein